MEVENSFASESSFVSLFPEKEGEKERNFFAHAVIVLPHNAFIMFEDEDDVLMCMQLEHIITFEPIWIELNYFFALQMLLTCKNGRLCVVEAWAKEWNAFIQRTGHVQKEIEYILY